jgi:hypothetical protein
MCSIEGEWPWTGLIRSCARAAPTVVIHRRSTDTCSSGDVARIKSLEKKAGGCHLGSMCWRRLHQETSDWSMGPI